MVELEMRALGLFALLLSTGTLAQVQRPRSACVENAIAVPCTAGSHVQQTTSAEGNRGCTICRDDLRLISFPLSHELNQNVTAPADGMVVPTNLRTLYVEGLTRPGLLDAVKKAHSKLFQMAFSAVPGQVEKPGPYLLRYDRAVVQAIAVAGGLAPRAKSQVFLHRSVSSNCAELQECKIKDLFHGRNISEDMYLRPGDMIFVPEKQVQTSHGERLLRWWQRA